MEHPDKILQFFDTDGLRWEIGLKLFGDLVEARAWHFRLLPFFKGAFIETNPAPIKALLELDGIGTAETRLPLVPASGAARERLQQLLAAAEWRVTA